MFSSTVVIIVLACGMALSYALNVWLTYYICCNAKRRKKRHLTAVQQKGTESQGEMDNPALEHDGDEKPSKLVSQAKPVSQEKNDFRHSEVQECQGEHAPRNNTTNRQEKHPHVYQMVEPGLFTAPMTNYHEMVNFPGHSPTNLQHKTKASLTTKTKSAYHSLIAVSDTSFSLVGCHFSRDYSLLSLVTVEKEADKSQSTSAKDENVERIAGAAIPDYIEIISDEDFTKIRKAASPSQTLLGKNNPYEPLKPSPGSRIQQACKEKPLADASKDQQANQSGDDDEDDYWEPLDDSKP